MPEAGSTANPLVELRDLSVRYGGVSALDHVSLSVERGTLVGLIGPNGAGKTTLVDAMTGFVGTTSGEIVFDGRPLGRASAHDRARRGLARTFQSIELFEDLTVRENVLVSVEPTHWYSIVTQALWPSRHRDDARVDWALELVDLADAGPRMPRELSQGQRKLVGVARALAREPRLVLLDEPAAGLDTGESEALGRQLRGLLDHGITVLLVDHDMGLVLGVCDTIWVLEFGRIIAHGAPREIQRDQAVVAAYLGERGERDGRGQRRVTTSTQPTDEIAAGATGPVIELRGLSAGYDRIPVVRDLDLHVDAGEIVALLGPNGAGKTTTLLTVSGILPVLSGEARVLGEPVSTRRPHRIARRGVAHVPEDRALFFGLSSQQNLRLGQRRGSLRGRRARARAETEQALELFPALRTLMSRRAGLLSGGEQQMLALARALVARPKVLMVDEMSMGLAPLLVEQLLPVLRTVAEQTGAGILLVEQHVHMALEVADRAYVMVHGRVVLEDTTSVLAERTDLLEASYLGTHTPG